VACPTASSAVINGVVVICGDAAALTGLPPFCLTVLSLLFSGSASTMLLLVSSSTYSSDNVAIIKGLESVVATAVGVVVVVVAVLVVVPVRGVAEEEEEEEAGVR